MANLTQSSQANLPDWSQEQVANAVSFAKISDRRRRNEMIRAGTSDPSAWAINNQDLITQANAPVDFWPAGSKQVASNVSDPRLANLFNFREGTDGEQYYWGDIDPSQVTLGTKGYTTQDTSPGKYNILGNDGSVLGTGYKDLQKSIYELGLSRALSKISHVQNAYDDLDPNRTKDEYRVSTGLFNNPVFDSLQEAQNYVTQDWNNRSSSDLGGPLGQWEALGQLLNNKDVRFTNKADLPSNKQTETVRGLNTLFGSTPVLHNNSLLGYMFDPTPGQDIGTYQEGAKRNNWGTGTVRGFIDNHGSTRYNNIVSREINPGDWSITNSLKNGDLFVTPENAEKIPGWTNKDSYAYSHKSGGFLGKSGGLLGSIFSLIPGLQPLGLALSVGSSLANDNPLGAIFSMAGGLGGFDSIANGISSSTGLPSVIAKALVQGGAGGLSSVARGGDFLRGAAGAGLGSFAGSSLGDVFKTQLGDMGSKMVGGAANMGIRSLFSQDKNSGGGSLYGGMSGGLHGYLNSDPINTIAPERGSPLESEIFRKRYRIT